MNNVVINPIVPEELSAVVAISAGSGYNLALTLAGRVAAWGAWEDYPPSDTALRFGLERVAAISAGAGWGLALLENGQVAAWPGTDLAKASILGGLHDIVAVSAGYDFHLALKSDRTVIGWGTHIPGRNSPPRDLKDVLALSAGYSRGLAIVRSGGLVLDAPRWLPDGSFAWSLAADPGRSYTVQSSTNLTVWENAGSIAPLNNTSTFVDTNAWRHMNRFYRVLAE